MDMRYHSYTILSRHQSTQPHPEERRMERYLAKHHSRLKKTSSAQADLVLIFGGDGTLLEAMRTRGPAPQYFLAFNTGKVGFLSTTRDQQRFTETLELALAGQLVSMPISLMRIKTHTEKKTRTSYAVNDIVIDCPMTWVTQRVELVRRKMITPIKDVRGSGLCVCSAIGSTTPMSMHHHAPRIDPALHVFYVKGIHDTRPPASGLLLSGDAQRLRITVTNIETNLGIPETHRQLPTLFLDGLHRGTLTMGDYLEIEYLTRPSILLRRADETHWDRVREPHI